MRLELGCGRRQSYIANCWKRLFISEGKKKALFMLVLISISLEGVEKEKSCCSTLRLNVPVMDLLLTECSKNICHPSSLCRVCVLCSCPLFWKQLKELQLKVLFCYFFIIHNSTIHKLQAKILFRNDAVEQKLFCWDFPNTLKDLIWNCRTVQQKLNK